MNRQASRQRGQSLMEYLVISAALAFFLFVPISDDASGDAPRTTAELLFDGLRAAYKNISHSISLPT